MFVYERLKAAADTTSHKAGFKPGDMTRYVARHHESSLATAFETMLMSFLSNYFFPYRPPPAAAQRF